jgi:hypothetical protein
MLYGVGEAGTHVIQCGGSRCTCYTVWGKQVHMLYSVGEAGTHVIVLGKQVHMLYSVGEAGTHVIQCVPSNSASSNNYLILTYTKKVSNKMYTVSNGYTLSDKILIMDSLLWSDQDYLLFLKNKKGSIKKKEGNLDNFVTMIP